MRDFEDNYEGNRIDSNRRFYDRDRHSSDRNRSQRNRYRDRDTEGTHFGRSRFENDSSDYSDRERDYGNYGSEFDSDLRSSSFDRGDRYPSDYEAGSSSRRGRFDRSSGGMSGESYGSDRRFGTGYGAGLRSSSDIHGRDLRGRYWDRRLRSRGMGAGNTADYSGLGPKNYRRSDERVLDEVCDRLIDSSDVDASNLEISVDDGVVTLKGTVSDKWMKYEAEELAEQVRGVNDIKNEISVSAKSESESDRFSSEDEKRRGRENDLRASA